MALLQSTDNSRSMIRAIAYLNFVSCFACSHIFIWNSVFIGLLSLKKELGIDLRLIPYATISMIFKGKDEVKIGHKFKIFHCHINES